MNRLPALPPELALRAHWALVAKVYANGVVRVDLAKLDLRTRRLVTEELLQYDTDQDSEAAVRMALHRGSSVVSGFTGQYGLDD